MESALAASKDQIFGTDSRRPVSLNMNEKHWCLKKSAVFGHLSDDELNLLGSQCQIREFGRGDMVYFPSDAGDCAHIVARGRIRIYHITGDGKQAILNFVDAGAVFGELSAFTGACRDEYSEATEKSVVVQVPRYVLIRTMEQVPSVSRKLNELFGQRVKQMERRLKSVLFGSSRERLWDLLQDLAVQYGSPTAAGKVIAQKISHQDLASIIGATRETVTITLGEMQTEGLIEIHNRRITLRTAQTTEDNA